MNESLNDQVPEYESRESIETMSTYETFLRIRDRFNLVLRESLRRLNDMRSEEILIQRLGLEGSPSLTLEEVGNFFSISRERVRQLEVKAFQQLREAIANFELGQELINDLGELVDRQSDGWQLRRDWIAREVLPSTPSSRSSPLIMSLANLKSSQEGNQSPRSISHSKASRSTPAPETSSLSIGAQSIASGEQGDRRLGSPTHSKALSDLDVHSRLIQLGILERGQLNAPRRGSPWTDVEDLKLSSEFGEGWSLELMMLSHQRTNAGIRSRLVRLELVDNRMTAVEIEAAQGSKKGDRAVFDVDLYVSELAGN
jgi:hypothetical protein